MQGSRYVESCFQREKNLSYDRPQMSALSLFKRWSLWIKRRSCWGSTNLWILKCCFTRSNCNPLYGKGTDCVKNTRANGKSGTQGSKVTLIDGNIDQSLPYHMTLLCGRSQKRHGRIFFSVCDNLVDWSVVSSWHFSVCPLSLFGRCLMLMALHDSGNHRQTT